MKKVLSMLLAIVMVLTMAAFPAFAAEPAAITVSSVTADAEAAEGKIANVIDGNPGSYFKTASIAQGNGTDPILTLTFDLGMPYDITSLDMNWGSCRMAKAIVYGANSADATEWNVIHNFSAAPTWTADSASGGNTTSVEVTSEGYYRYIKFEVLTLNRAGQVAIREITFNGVIDPSLTKIEGLNASNVSYSGASLRSAAKQNMDTLFDGDLTRTPSSAAAINGIQFDWTPSATVKKIEVTLNEVTNIAAFKLFWGNSDSNAKPAQTYNIYFAGEDGVYGSAAYTYTDNATSYNGVSRDDVVILDNVAVAVKKIMIEITAHYATGDPALREIEIYKSNAVIELIPATYTVKYKSDDPNFVAPADKVVEGKYVGNKVTETAPEITGYTVDEASKQLTLVDGTNEIVFTYYPRETASYTVYYQDTEGTDIADATVVKEGVYKGDTVTVTPAKVAGYKPTETSKEVTLEAGENTITFTYNVAESVTYTVNYVDEEGNPVADSKTGEGYEDDVVTEVPVVVSGYFCTDVVRSVNYTLTTGENVITFTYKKVLIPTGVIRKQMSGASNSGNDLTRLSDGDMSAYTQYTVPANYDFSVRPAEYIYSFSSLTNFEKVTVYTNANRAKTVKIYTTIDGETWDLVYTSAYENSARADETSFTLLTEKGVSTTAYVREFTLPAGTAGTQLKYEVVDTNVDAVNATWCGIYEIIVEGSEIESLVLDNASVIEAPNFGWATSTIDGTDATLFDGEPATDKKGYFSHSYWNESIDTDDDGEEDTFLGVRSANPKNYYFIVDLGALYDIDTLALQGGAPDWNFTAPMGYNVYFAGVDGKFSTTPDHTVMKHATDVGESLTAETKVRTDVLTGEADSIRYIKIEFTAATRRPVVGEIALYGTKVDPVANPEKAGASNGAQIRLPSGTVPAGIRFGATIAKDVFGDVLSTGDYNYSELAAAGIKVGMFILPADLLGGNATLADYIMNGGVQDALEVPAERVYAEDDFAVTFTAVLKEIPDTAYNRDIVAVPYIYMGGEYTFYAEMTRTYAVVATEVAEDYEAGEITLTAEQITLIEGIIGKTLVAPEVA